MTNSLKKIKAGHYENETFIVAKNGSKWSFARKDSGKTFDDLYSSIYLGRIFWTSLRDLKAFLAV